MAVSLSRDSELLTLYALRATLCCMTRCRNKQTWTCQNVNQGKAITELLIDRQLLKKRPGILSINMAL
jgi:hypothetical protein